MKPFGSVTMNSKSWIQKCMRKEYFYLHVRITLTRIIEGLLFMHNISI